MAFGGFGTTSTAPAFGTSTFGAQKPAGSAFGGFGTTSSAGPAFGTPGSTTGFGATSAFGAPTSNALGGGSTFSFTNTPNSNLIRPTATFGTTAPAFGGFQQQQPQQQQSFFGQPQQQQQQQQFQLQQPQQQQQQQQQYPAQNSEMANLCAAVTSCSVFGDDRDALIARWNLVQASWGVGKAYFHSSAQPITLTQDNPLCRFKAVAYSELPKIDKDSESQLSCAVRKKQEEIEKVKSQIIADISSTLGNRPNVRVTIDSINGYESSDVTELIFSVAETNPANGTVVRKVAATEVLPILTQPNVAQGMMQKYGIEGVSQRCAYTGDQLRDYLENPPCGIDPRLWRQAQLDNPDPKRLIPVPMIGFKALQTRIKCQEMQAKNQQGLLDSIASDISKLQKSQQETCAKLLDAKRKQLELGHRVLKVIIGQEVTRKRGYTIQPEEENLRIQLEALQAEMSAPTQFKGRLNELLSQVRLQSQASAMSGGSKKYNIDQFVMSDIRSLLKQEQDGLHAIVNLIKNDLADLNTIEVNGKPT